MSSKSKFKELVNEKSTRMTTKWGQALEDDLFDVSPEGAAERLRTTQALSLELHELAWCVAHDEPRAYNAGYPTCGDCCAEQVGGKKRPLAAMARAEAMDQRFKRWGKSWRINLEAYVAKRREAYNGTSKE